MKYTIHKVNTDKFKTNLIAVMLTTKLDKNKVTFNALIPAVLKRGTSKLKTQEDINKNLEEMYGASLDCGLDKTGDNQVLKFYIESICDDFLPSNEESLLKKSIESILDFVFNPLVENDCFKKEYVEQEKENLKQIIEGKSDNKGRYAIERCIEEMYKDDPYGLYKYGYIEDLKNINEKNLYEHYLELINNCKIDIFVSGILDDNIEEIIDNNKNMKKICDREPEFVMPKTIARRTDNEKIVCDSLEVTQGKVVIGLDIDVDDENLKYAIMLYNSILGGSANSKLFQNVREKASLAYTASSSYYRFKNNIIINCGIEIANYDKAVKIIKEQLKEMEEGKITEHDVEEAKQGIIAAIKTIEDEQDTQITYIFGQELSNVRLDINSYISKIKDVRKEDIIDIANKISINTIYFLRD